MQKLKFIILVTGIFIISVRGINYFVYSFDPLHTCDYKSLKSFNPTGSKVLGSSYNLQQIASDLRGKLEYTFEYKPNSYATKDPTKEDPDGAIWGSYMHIFRTFNGVKYIITLRDGTLINNSLGHTEYDVETEYNPKDENKIKCSTPDFKIRNTVKQMINGLPISSVQKDELKSNIEVERVMDWQY